MSRASAQRPLIVVICLLILLGGAVAWRWYGQRDHERGVIRGSGMIEVTEVDVSFEVGGRVVERAADEGQLLDRGEPVARLDEREYRLQVERATAMRAAAEAHYQLTLHGSRAQEIDEALAALEAAGSGVSLASAEHRRVSALRRGGVVSAAELDHSAAALASAEAARDQARARLDMLKQGARTEEIEEARARLHEAEKSLELAELNLSRCQLFAPLAGRVLSKNREPGEMVRPGDPIITIGDLTRPWLNIYVGERDLGRIAVGMKAEVTVDSFPHQPFTGRISFVSEQSEFTPKNIQPSDERVKLVY